MIDLPPALPPERQTPPDGPPTVLLLESEPQSAGYARAFVQEFIGYHHPDMPGSHVDDVALVASELVTNAYRYGTEPGDSIQVVLDTDDRRTRIEVHDPVRRTPRLRPRSPERDRGRGLLIVNALCPDRWGIGERPLGKYVWAEVTWNS
ncbi:ATP-binding protein [Streptomyces sp. NPDC092046]|uniref:ATP-binding protein n=1 Tax=Streptomyces sp. NPDC092046 TaxID=3366009 RepID=UPI0037F6CAB6